MRRALVGLLASAAVVLTGCSAETLPEVTFYADGETVTAQPLTQYCDELLRDCEKAGDAASLTVRPGEPVQISVPSEVTDTVWSVVVQYRDASGALRLRPQRTFTDLSRHAYTVRPPAPTDQLVVVEVQQIGKAYAADAKGNPILDEAGNPQLVTRGVWSLQLEPGR